MLTLATPTSFAIPATRAGMRAPATPREEAAGRAREPTCRARRASATTARDCHRGTDGRLVDTISASAEAKAATTSPSLPSHTTTAHSATHTPPGRMRPNSPTKGTRRVGRVEGEEERVRRLRVGGFAPRQSRSLGYTMSSTSANINSRPTATQTKTQLMRTLHGEQSPQRSQAAMRAGRPWGS